MSHNIKLKHVKNRKDVFKRIVNMRYLKFLVAAVFLLSLDLEAQSEIVLQYDRGETDGMYTFGLDGWFFTTRFTPPSEVQLRKARFYIPDTSNGATYHLSIYHDTGGEPAGAIVDKVPMRVKKPGWNEIDLTSFNVVKDQDFYISIEYDFESELSIGVDRQEPISGRSYDSDC